MMRLGLIGNPVSHSRSPRMHNAAFAAMGIDATYELWPTETEDVPARVEALRRAEFGGANVTVPHKELALSLVDEVAPAATRIGAVNTIIKSGDHLLGDNTDAYGYRMSVDATQPGFRPTTAVVLGAGGASRAVVVALQDMGARDVVIVNRTYQRALGLARDLNASAADWSQLPELLPQANVVANATSLGWHDESVLDAELLDLLPTNALVTDLTYAFTSLLRAAAERGLATLDGAGMLVHQGVRSFELWFGVTPPVDLMTAAAFGTSDG